MLKRQNLPLHTSVLIPLFRLELIIEEVEDLKHIQLLKLKYRPLYH